MAVQRLNNLHEKWTEVKLLNAYRFSQLSISLQSY